ncbi:MAG TPA: cellulase family glycosylhydrolase [Aquella sp.]|nr:cellulase family glycosylhydrolase [Aquella sp.]
MLPSCSTGGGNGSDSNQNVNNLLVNELPVLHTKNGIIYDQFNRIVILHGVNEVNKQYPYLAGPSYNGFDEPHIKFIADHGFNAVRLGVYWASIEPSKSLDGTELYNDEYLSEAKKMITLLAKHNIYTLVDFHMDAYSLKSHGLGAPDWATIDTSMTNAENPGFPLNYFAGAIVGGKMVPYEVANNYDAFWTNAQSIQDHYIQMVNHTVQYLNNTPGVLGFDIMNEPHPGTQWTIAGYINNDGEFSFSKGCESFDKDILNHFYVKLINTVHSLTPDAVMYYEPSSMSGLGAQEYIGNFNIDDGKNIGYSFHNYWTPDLSISFNHAKLAKHDNHATPLMTEFGADTVDHNQLDYLLSTSDQENMSWFIWTFSNNPTYKFSQWPGGRLPKDPSMQGIVYNLHDFITQNCLQNNNCTAVNWDLLSKLDRPYPQFIAGENPTYKYDENSKVFSLNYTINSGLGNQLTQIYIPQSQYKNGYTVSIIGGIEQKFPKQENTLLIRNILGGNLVKVIVTPN